MVHQTNIIGIEVRGGGEEVAWEKGGGGWKCVGFWGEVSGGEEKDTLT